MENVINVVVGRPGSGKTSWACQEAITLAADVNNIVIYIGRQQELERIVSEREYARRGNLRFAGIPNAGAAIGSAIDLANAVEDENGQYDSDKAPHQMVYLFYDQCRCDAFHGRRDILEAAAKAGVIVYVICQSFEQVDKGDVEWLNKNCRCMVISKGRPPRNALPDEMMSKYR